MKHKDTITRYFFIAVLVTWTAMFFSCRDDIDIINRSISEATPTQVVNDFVTTYTDSALLKLRLESPYMEYFGKMEEPYSEFPKGITVTFYDETGAPSGKISARYGKYFEQTRLWEVRDSVVAINEKNELLETEQLYWDDPGDLIYTDKYVRITQQDQIIQGYGLESDPRFLKWKIKNVTATLYIDDEQ